MESIDAWPTKIKRRDGKQMKKRGILIVDDELYIRQLLSITLGNDYSVLMAGDGEEAINIALAPE